VVVRILIIAAVVLFLILWVRAVVDVVARGDLTGLGKAAWIVGMLVLPFVGLLVYTMLRPGDAEIARRARN
jgi:Phospholipase_D-nuclease N-terminal